ncbi:hypothetical protein [Zhihengliuella sp. ISTPL4]|uniref:hypothetical protein n=1 Tax=Zhihengliuella sp. ISTPL4 TaxID=2058657 RepID=UPI000C7AEB84|nr:hypothetical protein [Zhihengliuella sp. ISTPL4]
MPNATPPDIAGAVFSSPAVSLALGIVVAALLALTPWWRGGRAAATRLSRDEAGAVVARYGPERRLLAVGAVVVLGAGVTVEVLARHVLRLDDHVSWWRYATPVLATTLALAALALAIAARRARHATLPVVTGTRRTWLSFSARGALPAAGSALLVLVLTTIASGSASSNVDGGPFVFLAIPAPNTDVDPVRLWFFGWAYGLPVLLSCGLLVASAVWALSANATRPFLRPETVPAEHHERRRIAAGIAQVATGGVLLTVAAAWRFIGNAGRIGPLTIEGEGTFEVVWRYADIARAAGVVAPALEVTAVVLLVLSALAMRPAISRGSAGPSPAEPLPAEGVR